MSTALTIPRSGTGPLPTMVVTVEVLSPGVVSIWPGGRSTVAVLVMVPVLVGCTTIEKLWLAPFDALRTQSSPIVAKGYVFLADNDVQLCFDATNGSQRWNAAVPGSISSPLLADGKLFVMINNGNNVQVLRADGTERAEIGKANVRAAWVPSPTIADGKLLLRLKDRIRCFSLTD